MKVLIVEDEPLAAERLVELLGQYDASLEILAPIDSVKQAIEWFSQNHFADLVFMDIELADGISFEIFNSVMVTVPIIFTTAYDHYAVQAFKVNSVDYLLKPFDLKDITLAMEKYHTHYDQAQYKKQLITLKNVLKSLEKEVEPDFKSRFVVKVGEHIKAIDIENILFFYSEHKATFTKTVDNKKYLLDYSLDKLEQLVDPAEYFRVNRKYLVCLRAVEDIISYSNSRLKLILKNCNPTQDILVSRDRVSDFKIWLDS